MRGMRGRCWGSCTSGRASRVRPTDAGKSSAPQGIERPRIPRMGGDKGNTEESEDRQLLSRYTFQNHTQSHNRKLNRHYLVGLYSDSMILRILVDPSPFYSLQN